MRTVIWLVLLFAGSVVVATFLGRNDALVSFYYGDWRLDMSLNLFLLALAAGVFLLLGGQQVISSLLSLPGRAREWRDLKRERAAGVALREAQAELSAGRFARAHRAARRAMALQAETHTLRHDTQFTVLGHLVEAEAWHRLQNRSARDQATETALSLARHALGAGLATEGVQLQMAAWALEDRDPERGASLLAELPAGVGRRTQALRLKLQVARQLKHPLDGLQTARLLAKHQGFSKAAAQSLLRTLAGEALDQSFDSEQLLRNWASLDAVDRADPWVVARGARRAAALGRAELGREWLRLPWEKINSLEPDAREQLALALADCAAGLGSEWLPRLEAAQALNSQDPALAAASGLAFADRQLWGKARRLLEQAASDVRLLPYLRRRALRVLAAMAREQGQLDVAQACDQRAAAIE
jgi:HemY protein